MQVMVEVFISEHRAQKKRIESGSDEVKVKKRKRYKKIVTKMFTNDEGEMGEISMTTVLIADYKFSLSLHFIDSQK